MTKNYRTIMSAAILAGTLALGTAFSASAQEMTPPPEPKLDPHDILAPYAAVIMYMKKADGGSCCGFQDGMAKVPEIHTDYPAVMGKDGKPHADPNGTHYHLHFTKDKQGNTLPNGGFWEDVTDDRILSIQQFDKVAKDHANDPTFKKPPFGVVWTNNNFPSADNPGAILTVYCYWPVPKLQ